MEAHLCIAAFLFFLFLFLFLKDKKLKNLAVALKFLYFLTVLSLHSTFLIIAFC